jgi:hypothetical protein
LSLFLYLWCGLYCTQNCTVRPKKKFFFLTERKLGLSLALDRRGCLGQATSQRLARQTRARPQRLSVVGRAGAHSFFLNLCRSGLEAMAREQKTISPMELPSRTDRDSFEECERAFFFVLIADPICRI